LIGREINIQLVAAVLTIVGYSINDTIVIYDRIRELADVPGNRGVPLAKIINKATNEMLGRTILTSTTTWMSSLALFLIAGGAIEDFALAMLVGVIAGVYSTIYVASPLIILFRDVIDKKKAASAA
jgi:preprotein translocase subunit SecF